MDFFVLFLIFLSLFIFIALTYDLSSNVSKTLLFLDYTTLILFTTKVIFTLLSIFIVAAALIYGTKHNSNPSINNFSDAFYFIFSTATTVGFGDIVTVTDLGR